MIKDIISTFLLQVADRYGIKGNFMHSAGRPFSSNTTADFVYLILKEQSGLTTTKLGKIMNKDHSAFCHASKRATAALAEGKPDIIARHDFILTLFATIRKSYESKSELAGQILGLVATLEKTAHLLNDCREKLNVLALKYDTLEKEPVSWLSIIGNNDKKAVIYKQM